MRSFHAVLLLIVGFSSSSYAQTADDYRIIMNSYRNQLEFEAKQRAAVETGEALFGVDPRLKAETEAEYRGDLINMKPPDFKIGAWGYTRQIFETIDIVSDSEILVIPVYRGADAILIRGIDTSKAIDGAEVIFQYPFVIAETYRYQTVGGGSETVFVMDVTKVDGKIAEFRAAAELALYRDWTIRDAVVSAKFIDFKKNTVSLVRKDDASEVSIPMLELLKADQKWVKDEVKKRKEIDAAKRAQERKSKKR
jgi:hypothetical protein